MIQNQIFLQLSYDPNSCVQGGSRESHHENWIEAVEVKSAVSNPSKTDRVQMPDVTVTKFEDASSEILWKEWALGRLFHEALIESIRVDDWGGRTSGPRMRLNKVQIRSILLFDGPVTDWACDPRTSFVSVSSEGLRNCWPRAMEQITFSFERITWEFPEPGSQG